MKKLKFAEEYQRFDAASASEKYPNALDRVVEGENAIRALYNEKPLDLKRKESRDAIYTRIMYGLEPEALFRDGEASRSEAYERKLFLNAALHQLEQLH